MADAPVPFEVHESGAYLHGTKADLRVGEVLEAGRRSNYGAGRAAGYVYLTRTLDAATWGAELAAGDGPGRIYVVEPTGDLEDDPDVTDQRFPGNPTQSYRTREPVRVVGELTDWVGHPAEQLRTMREHLAELERQGVEAIDD
ncbi:NAD(+)--rifampin ADP-ribosyltransferase [Cellulomonas biazotea]|nr:NAD(+)--rifampin ADP-ribosyltransferase [Cellulomonas biazotea]